MDHISEAASRLWGPLGEGGRLHPSPRFADELAGCCDNDLEVIVEKVSKWSYGDQLEHLYLGSHYVLDRIEEAMSGKNERARIGFWGVGMMVGGFMPRYVFPTIPPLVPRSGTLEHIAPLRETLKGRIQNLQWRLDEIRANPGKSLHPRMKYLTSAQWLFFADIHHRHHMAIMRDILKAAGVTPVVPAYA
jgi:hypothetical protein